MHNPDPKSLKTQMKKGMQAFTKPCLLTTAQTGMTSIQFVCSLKHLKLFVAPVPTCLKYYAGI